VLRVFGHTLFGWIAYAGKNIHNFVGPACAGSVLMMFGAFVRDNPPGLIVSAFGVVLDMLVPGIVYSRGNMQIANVARLAAMLACALSLGPICLGTIGMKGAAHAGAPVKAV